MKFPATLAVTVAALLGSSGVAAQYLWQAREAEEAAKATPRSAAAAPIRSAGLTAFIDPATGTLRPAEHEEMREMDRAARAAAAAEPPIAFITGVGGAQGVLLNRSFDSYFIARKGADGTLDISCIPGVEQASTAPAMTVGMVQRKVVADEK